jgi:hypothetical protein
MIKEFLSNLACIACMATTMYLMMLIGKMVGY